MINSCESTPIAHLVSSGKVVRVRGKVRVGVGVGVGIEARVRVRARARAGARTGFRVSEPRLNRTKYSRQPGTGGPHFAHTGAVQPSALSFFLCIFVFASSAVTLQMS